MTHDHGYAHGYYFDYVCSDVLQCSTTATIYQRCSRLRDNETSVAPNLHMKIAIHASNPM